MILGRVLLTGWAILWGALATAFFGILFVLGSPFDRRGKWMDLMLRGYGAAVLGGLGMRLRVLGREHLEPGRACVLISNHQSLLDIPALALAAIRHSVRFVYKRELEKIPALGWALAASTHIKVDRGDREQAVAALSAALARIKSGVAIAVFPEGTRSPDRRLLPFKKGGFYIAVDSGLPIVPVTIVDSGEHLGKRSPFVRPGTITVVIHPAREVVRGDRKGIPALLNDVRAAIASALPAEVPSPP